MEKKSTNDAIFALLEKLFLSLNDEENAAAVFCDFSKAFDCVDHGILLRKLGHYGVQVHEYKVAMTCEGCSGAVERVLAKHKDKIEKVDIDLKGQQVKVTTNLPAEEILEIIKKTGKETTYVASS